MKREIFFDEEENSWECDLDSGLVINPDSELKGQSIPTHWKKWENSKPGNLLNSPNCKKDLWADYKY